MDMTLERNIESDEDDVQLKKIEIYIPKWLETLPYDHPLKNDLVEKTREWMTREYVLREDEKNSIHCSCFEELEFINNVSAEYLSDGKVRVRLNVEDRCYYEMLSSMTGVEVSGEYQLISLIRELSELKQEYMNAKQALISARNTGYGVVMPKQDEIRLEEPVVIRQGNKFGVKIKASCPSVHLIRTEIETEISPIVGNEKQAEDLIAYIKGSANSGDGIWETNIFGKSIEQLTEDGIRTKLSQIGEDSQHKLQKMMQRIVNETNNGFICIIL